MLEMLDGNEHAACEAVGQEFESLLQYQLSVSAGRGTVSKTAARGFDSFHRCQVNSQREAAVETEICDAGIAPSF